jgi:ATP-dependent RNA helicase DHX36
MSATLNADSFVRYFPGCATVAIPGRSHPVREYRLEDILQQTGYDVPENSEYAKKKGPNKREGMTKSELRRRYSNYSANVIGSLEIVDESIINYELLAQLLLYIVDNEENGAVLVFLPGIMEISKAMDEIRRIEKFQTPAFRIFPLHSSLSTAEQVAVFEVPPEGVRKIVLASNIAETSITIEGTRRIHGAFAKVVHFVSLSYVVTTWSFRLDVVFVVDSGRVKENRRDEIKETPALVECWVSRASAKQRRGRAGRVRAGVAYHFFSRCVAPMQLIHATSRNHLTLFVF